MRQCLGLASLPAVGLANASQREDTEPTCVQREYRNDPTARRSPEGAAARGVIMTDRVLGQWLDSPQNPAVRYLYHRDFARPETGQRDIEKMRLKMLAWQPLRQLLALQADDGGFANATKGFPAQTTYWALDLMARCGMDVRDEPVSRALAWVEERFVSHGAYSYNRGGSGVLPCYVGNVARNVMALAGHERPSAQSAIRWLLDYQRFDHKNKRAGGRKRWPFKSVDNYGGCWWSVSCYHGVVSALRAFAAVPVEHRSRQIQNRITAALRYLKIHRVHRRSGSDQQLFKHMTQFFLAGDYRVHLIDVLEAISEVESSLIEQEWIRQAVETVDSLAESGKIPLVKNYAKRLMDPLPFEPVGEPSRFLTLQWLRTKRRFGLA